MQTPERQQVSAEIAPSPSMPPPTPPPIPPEQSNSELQADNDQNYEDQNDASSAHSTVKFAENSKLHSSQQILENSKLHSKQSKRASQKRKRQDSFGVKNSNGDSNASKLSKSSVNSSVSEEKKVKAKSQFEKFETADVTVNSDCEESPLKTRKKKARSARRLVKISSCEQVEEAIVSFKNAPKEVVPKRITVPKVKSNEDWVLLEKVPLEDFEATLRKHVFTCCDFSYNRTLWYADVRKANPSLPLGVAAESSDKETNTPGEGSKTLRKGVGRKSVDKAACLHPIRNLDQLKQIVVPEQHKSPWLCTMHFKGCNHPTCSRKTLLHKGKISAENDIDNTLLSSSSDDLCTFNIKAYANKRDAEIYFTGKHCKEFQSDVSLLKKDIIIKKEIENQVMKCASVKGKLLLLLF